MNDVDLRMILWSAADRHDVVAAKVASESESIFYRLRCKVLVRENKNFALRGKKCQLIFSRRIQFANLNSSYDGANGGSQIFFLGVSRNEIRKSLVGIQTMLYMVEWLKRWVLLRRIPSWKVCWILETRQCAYAVLAVLTY